MTLKTHIVWISVHPHTTCMFVAIDVADVTTKPCLTAKAQRHKESRRRPKILCGALWLCVSVVSSYSQTRYLVSQFAAMVVVLAKPADSNRRLIANVR
jgi:hypothetical protein